MLVSQKTEFTNTLLNAKILIIMLGLSFACHNRESNVNNENRIIIEMLLSDEIANPKPANFVLRDRLSIMYRPINKVANVSSWNTIESDINKYKVKWILYSDEPIEMNYGFGKLDIVSPGDSVFIKYDNEEPYYSGTGADKFIMWKLILEEEKKLGIPTKNSYTLNSTDDYFKWETNLDERLKVQLPIIDSFKKMLRPFEYDFLKMSIVSRVEREKINAFQALCKLKNNESYANDESINLNVIWDSLHNSYWSKWLRSMPDYYGSLYTLVDINKLEVYRRFNFDLKSDPIKTTNDRCYLYFTNAKQNFQGLIRERLLVYILNEIYLDTYGPKNPITQKLLKDYYSQPGFPEYKKWVKKMEDKASKKITG